MPSGQWPTVNAGTTYTAAFIQQVSPLRAWKSADTPRASTTTLANDPDLQIAVVANASYELEGELIYTGDVTGSGGVNFAFTTPGSSIFGWSMIYYATAISGTGISISASAGAGTGRAGVTNSTTAIAGHLRGYLFTGGSAGTLVLQWCQQASDATATVLKAGSRLKLERMA